MFNLISSNDFCFFQNFESIELFIISFFNEHDFSVRPLTNYRYHFKILFGYISSCCALLLSNNLAIIFRLLFTLFILLFTIHGLIFVLVYLHISFFYFSLIKLLSNFNSICKFNTKIWIN